MKEASLIWSVRKCNINELVPYDKNPRRISKKAYEKLKASLSEDGYHQRLLANVNGVIIGGHQRLRALKELGINEVEVLFPNRELTPIEFDRINVRDNLPFGEFDFDILANRFEADQLIEWGMPEDWLPKNETIVNEAAGDVDEAGEAPKQPKTVKGDVYEIGEHRLVPAYCDVIVSRMVKLYPDLPIKLNGKDIDAKTFQ